MQHQGWQVHVQVLGPGPDRCVPVMSAERSSLTGAGPSHTFPNNHWTLPVLLAGWGAQMSKTEKGQGRAIHAYTIHRAVYTQAIHASSRVYTQALILIPKQQRTNEPTY